MKAFLIILSVVILILGLAVTIIFFVSLSSEYNIKGNGSILMPDTGQVGDFIGGVVGTAVAFSGTILLLLTLNLQSRSNALSSFESKFFKLIELHRANIDEIAIFRGRFGSKEPERIEKRQAFKNVFDEIIECKEEITPFIKGRTETDIYDEKYLSYLKYEFSLADRTIDFVELATINIAYCAVFFGVNEQGLPILKKTLQGKFASRLIEDIIDLLRMKPVTYSKYAERWNAISKIQDMSSRMEEVRRILIKRGEKVSMETFTDEPTYYGNDYTKYYGGNQFWLGHYYRHLFQTVKFVHTHDDLSPKEKYFYLKTLRAQLSTYEQALLLVNSLSIPGMIWELTPEYQRGDSKEDNKRRAAKSILITPYNLIKNLPGDELSGIRYKDYYPKVEFEIDRLMKST